MVWAMGALVVILLVLIAIGNLRLMLGFLATAVIVIVLLLVFDQFHQQRGASLIPVENIELIDFSISHGRGSVYELRGRVHNHTPKHGLFRLGLRIVALDCAAPETPAGQCTVIADQVQRLGVDIPAGQARDIHQRVQLRDAPITPRGELRWQFEVASTDAG